MTYYARPAAKSISDTVNTTAVYNPDGWRVLEHVDAGFKMREWDTSKGFEINKANLRAIYNYYRIVYTRSEQPNANQAGKGRMEWAGLAAVAGQSVFYTDAHMDSPITGYLLDLTTLLALPSFVRIGSSAVIAQGFGNVATSLASSPLNAGSATATALGGTLANMSGVLTDFLEISYRIFNDVGWQLQAYQTAGLHEMERIGDLNLRRRTSSG